MHIFYSQSIFLGPVLALICHEKAYLLKGHILVVLLFILALKYIF